MSTGLETRIDKGRKALARAQQNGLDTVPWQKKLASLQQQLDEKLQQARAVANRTRQLLDTRGWCKWQCQALRGEVIIVARDAHVTGMPAGLPAGVPAYTEAELVELTSGRVRPSTIRLVHEAKKTMHASIITEPNQPGGTK